MIVTMTAGINMVEEEIKKIRIMLKPTYSRFFYCLDVKKLVIARKNRAQNRF